MLRLRYWVGSVVLTLPAFLLQARPEVDSLQLPSHEIGEVVVMGARHESDLRLSAMPLTTLSRQEIDERHEASLLPLLSEQVPGLFISSRGVMGYGVSGGAAGAMSLRGVGGAPTTGLLVVIDGEPQYMGLMGHPLADSYLSSSVERVEVVRGPASVLYGSNAMGGVIHLSTRQAHQEGFHGGFRGGYGSWNTLQSDLRLELGAGPLKSSIGGLYNRSDGHRPNMEFGQYGARFNFSLRLGEHWLLGGSSEMLHYESSNPGIRQKPLIDADANILRARAALRLEGRYARHAESLNLFYNWGKHRINDGYAAGEEPQATRFHSRDKMWGVSLYEQLMLFQGSRITLGLDYFRFGGMALNRPIDGGRDEVLADKEEGEVALYAEVRQELFGSLILDAGLRWDHHSRVGTEWVPRVGLTLLLAREGELKASVAKGFRFPTIREMYLFPAQNPDLRPERLMHYELSWGQRLTQRALCYGINLFYIEGENIIRTSWEDGRPRNENGGVIENWGVEGEIEWQPRRWLLLEGNYSFLHMRYPTLASPEHKLHIGLRFSHKKWHWGVGWEYINGLYTVLESPTSAAVEEEFLNWSVDASWQAAGWLKCWLRGENLLDQRYEINAGFPMPGLHFSGGVEIAF